MKYLKASSIDGKEKLVLQFKLQSAHVLSKFDLQKAIPKVKVTLDKMIKSKYSNELKSLINKCKKILKDNK